MQFMIGLAGESGQVEAPVPFHQLHELPVWFTATRAAPPPQSSVLSFLPGLVARLSPTRQHLSSKISQK